MNFDFWSFYLSLENDFMNTVNYVHPSQENLNTFSSQYSKIILTCAIEFESISKIFVKHISSDNRAGNIGDIKQSLLREFPNIHSNIVSMQKYGIKMQPLEEWGTNQRLNWWSSYTSIKHNRHKNFNKANLENTLNSLSALLIINVYYYRYVYNYQHLSGNKLLDMAGMGEAIVCAPSNDVADKINISMK